MIDWDINPLVFLEFFFVLAFAIGWWVLERVASRYDKKPDEREPDRPGDSSR